MLLMLKVYALLAAHSWLHLLITQSNPFAETTVIPALGWCQVMISHPGCTLMVQDSKWPLLLPWTDWSLLTPAIQSRSPLAVQYFLPWNPTFHGLYPVGYQVCLCHLHSQPSCKSCSFSCCCAGSQTVGFIVWKTFLFLFFSRGARALEIEQREEKKEVCFLISLMWIVAVHGVRAGPLILGHAMMHRLEGKAACRLPSCLTSSQILCSCLPCLQVTEGLHSFLTWIHLPWYASTTGSSWGSWTVYHSHRISQVRRKP